MVLGRRHVASPVGTLRANPAWFGGLSDVVFCVESRACAFLTASHWFGMNGSRWLVRPLCADGKTLSKSRSNCSAARRERGCPEGKMLVSDETEDYGPASQNCAGEVRR